MSKDLPDIKNFGVPTYGLTTDENVNLRISAILNEAEHVFDWHAEGIWKDTYKEGYARLLANELIERPSLMRKLFHIAIKTNLIYSSPMEVSHGKSCTFHRRRASQSNETT